MILKILYSIFVSVLVIGIYHMGYQWFQENILSIFHNPSVKLIVNDRDTSWEKEFEEKIKDKRAEIGEEKIGEERDEMVVEKGEEKGETEDLFQFINSL
jgi:hypothetical protein